jgi:hypothetical protein
MKAFLQPFNVLILYDTVHAGTSAMTTYQRLTQELGDEYSFNLKLWRCDMLDFPSQVHWATKEAAEADMVIVAWDNSPVALDVLKGWAWQWPDTTTNSPRRALVALYTGAGIEKDTDGFDSCIGAFHALAERTGMDLITQNDELANGPHTQSAANLEPVVASLLVETSIQAHETVLAASATDQGVRHWGINE